jgi:hypothetical protein
MRSNEFDGMAYLYRGDKIKKAPQILQGPFVRIHL